MCLPGGCAYTFVCGACCLPDQTCTDDITGTDCVQSGGVFHGPGSDCMGDMDGDGCDDRCVQPSVPTTSGWALLVMLLVLLTGAKIGFGSWRQQCAA
jgi:hypothetical protein